MLTLFTTLLIAALQVYGDDVFAQMAMRLGFEERNYPCATDDGHVRIAISSNGTMTWNSAPIASLSATERIHNERIDIPGLCLYVQGPTSSESLSVLHAVVDAASRNNIQMARFTDSNFEKRVFPKFQVTQPSGQH
jgi:hypothetical protein